MDVPVVVVDGWVGSGEILHAEWGLPPVRTRGKGDELGARRVLETMVAWTNRFEVARLRFAMVSPSQDMVELAAQ